MEDFGMCIQGVSWYLQTVLALLLVVAVFNFVHFCDFIVFNIKCLGGKLGSLGVSPPPPPPRMKPCLVVTVLTEQFFIEISV